MIGATKVQINNINNEELYYMLLSILHILLIKLSNNSIIVGNTTKNMDFGILKITFKLLGGQKKNRIQTLEPIFLFSKIRGFFFFFLKSGWVDFFLFS